ncbi:MAG: tripartite tricarboxylate transporter permease [Bdellovibrionales bacterium]|nr:tripartite tricarboxylate transporter permease [Bdellovibrionales bacterium]
MAELDFFNGILVGLASVAEPFNLLMIGFGALLGILFGATPGLSPSMGVALLVPLSFGMDATTAFFFFVAVYQAANYGGSITAVAINTPGTPAAVVTALDGFPMTQQGHPESSFGYSLYASVVGGIIGAILLVLFAVPLAQVGLYFGPHEYFALAVFGLSTVVAFSTKAPLKAIVATLFGLLVSTIGTDPFSGLERSTFGVIDLYDGVSLLPAMIGLFALGEVFEQFSRKSQAQKAVVSTMESLLPLKRVFAFPRVLFGSSVLGTAIGVIPGAGATIASFICYGRAKKVSRTPEKFGDGAAEGIIASEAANSSSVGGALVPLLALGIPGSATDAVLLGALTLHGLTAGPELVRQRPDVVYGIFVALFVANFAIYFLGRFGVQIWIRILRIPQSIVISSVFLLCLWGSFTVRNSVFDCWVCLLFGVLGYGMKRGGYPIAPLVLGLVLGEMIEMNFRRALLMGEFSLFFTKPLSLVLLLLTLISLVSPVVKGSLRHGEPD